MRPIVQGEKHMQILYISRGEDGYVFYRSRREDRPMLLCRLKKQLLFSVDQPESLLEIYYRKRNNDYQRRYDKPMEHRPAAALFHIRKIGV